VRFREIMTPRCVLVAGATGRLGREIVRELKGRGYRVRALGRSTARLEALRDVADELCVADALDPATLPAAVENVDQIVSCLGASVIPLPQYGRRAFTRLDYPANRNLIEAAVAAQVGRFVYVSLFGAERLRHMDFVRGHEQVVEFLRTGGLDYAVVRPTGFFSSMEEIVLVASWGLLPESRGGMARTNPIHEADLAAFCADVLADTSGRRDYDVGGPEALTRQQIAQLAYTAIGKDVGSRRVPVSVLRGAGKLLRPFNPRVAHLMIFIAEVLADDFVAPAYGTRTLTDYFARRQGGLQDSV
jgi:uncharacterized protein YbjT (DUF2867 family)